MKKEEKKQRDDRTFSGRAAYMVAWRDRHIEKMEAYCKGLEGKCALLEALLACALQQFSSPVEAGRSIKISREELKNTLNRWQTSTLLREDAFEVTFSEKEEESEAAQEREA